MSYFDENSYEFHIIEQFKKMGYSYLDTNELYIQRGQNWSNVLLEEEIAIFLRKSYKDIDNITINKIIRKLKDVSGSSLEEGNKAFFNFLIEGVKIHNQILKKTLTYKLIDDASIKKNNFIISNQFNMKSSHPEFNFQRPDIVVYINGLPISVCELKSPKIEEDKINDAYKQVINYQIHLKDLFVYSQINILSDGTISKCGTITSSSSYYKYWRGKNFNETNTKDVLFSDLFKPSVLIDVILNYSFFYSNNKILTGYHQYYGVKSALVSLEKCFKTNKETGGVFWHTQGSGKSFSMLFLVKNFTKIRPNTTYLVITDRNDLDNQLFSTFKANEKYLNQKVKQMENMQILKETIKNSQQNGIIFTTIQKFRNSSEVLSNRDDLVVIVDEAHRSHNTLNDKLIINEDEMTLEEKDGLAKRLRLTIPNAKFIAFTGTPIEKEDVSTKENFGHYVSKYLMQHAEQDEVVVPIKYESRKAKLHLDPNKIEEINKRQKEIVASAVEKTKNDLPNETIKKLNKYIQSIKNLFIDNDRISGIAKDFVQHYETREKILKGKAMFVAFNREVAFKYYKEIIKLRPKWEKEEKIKLVITTTNKDNKDMLEVVGTKQQRNILNKEFKKSDSKTKILIVVDMWLTGYDVPSLNILYIDKPLKMHNLMQAIARTNRIYHDKKTNIKKENGLIVDYVGILKQLEEALAWYSGLKERDIKSKSDILELKKSYLTQVNLIYKNFLPKLEIDFLKIQDPNEKSYKFYLLEKAQDFIYETKKHREFVSSAKSVNSNFKTIASQLSQDDKFRFIFLATIRLSMIKLNFSRIDFQLIKKELYEMVDEAIFYNDIIAIDNTQNTNEQIQLSEIISFIKTKLKNNKYLNINRKVLATKALIKELRKIDIEKAKKMSDMLDEMIKKYDKKYITIQELYDFLNQIAIDSEELNKNLKNDMGYSYAEMAFFNKLFGDDQIKSQYDKDTITKIMNELLIIINKEYPNKFLWKRNQKLKKDVRADLKILLGKYNYPPNPTEQKVQDIVEQIEELTYWNKEGEN